MKAQSKSLHSGAVTVAQNDMPAEARVLASVRRNTAMLAISRIGSVLLDGLGYVLTARYFGPADYGIYVSLLGFINLMDAAADMTVLDITAREMAREPEHTGRWLVVSTVLRIILGLCGFLAYAVYLQVTPMSGELMSTAWIGAWILAASALRMPVAVFQASMKLHFELAIMLVSRAFNLALFLGLMFSGGVVYQFFLATFASRMLLVVISWAVVLKVFRVHLEFAWTSLKRLVRESLPMGISGSFVAVQLKADILMVASLISAAAGGLYAAVAQLADYSLYIPLIITTPMFPVLSQAFAQGENEQFQSMYQRMFQAVVAVLLPAVVVATLMPRECVLFLFGDKYASSAAVVPVLMLSIAAMWISHAIAIGTVALGLQANFIWIQAICIAVYVGLDLFVIPRWSFVGAGVVRLITCLIAPLLTYYVVRKRTGFVLTTAGLRQPVFAALLMAGVLWLCSGLPFVLAATIACVTYALAAWGPLLLRGRSSAVNPL